MTAAFTAWCPFCGREHDLHSHPQGATPEPLDRSICWGCGNIAVYEDDLSLRRPTPEEEAEHTDNLAVQQALAARRSSLTPSMAMRRLREQS
jgi:hypothetical protein